MRSLWSLRKSNVVIKVLHSQFFIREKLTFHTGKVDYLYGFG